jgi:lipopolysaccharide transport system ATP-binding protein
MMEQPVVIAAEGLRKTYKLYQRQSDRLREALNPFGTRYHKDFHALKGLDFTIRKGETVGILGRNGSGKSTLLKILTGVLTPSGGIVRVDGQVSALLELGAGFNPEHTGLDNIFLAGTLRGIPRPQMQEKLQDIVDFADIGEFLYQKVKLYSSGMFARLAFAVAINTDPDILIIDEALSVGDAAFRRKCYAKMESLRQRGATILFVSHSESAIIELCSRAILMDAGEILAEGQPKQMVASYLKLLNAQGDAYLRQREAIRAGAHAAALELTAPQVSAAGEDEMFVDGLQPVSTITYESHGAVLLDPRIETQDGTRVNRLVHGRRYRYCYDVRFEQDATAVAFGMAIKTVKGVELCKGSFPRAGEQIASVKAGELCHVCWEFDCLLEEGEDYFTNCGVSALQDGERHHLHRIIDACMFRVAPRKGRITAAYVNLNISASAAMEDVA